MRRSLCLWQGARPYELPDEIRKRLSKQLEHLYPEKKGKKRSKKVREMETLLDETHPVKELDMAHLERDGEGAEGLKHVLANAEVVQALGNKKKKSEAKELLRNRSKWSEMPEGEVRGKNVMRLWEAKQVLADGGTLLDSEMKTNVPVDHLSPEDKLRLWGKAPSYVEAKDELDADSLAFVLRSSLNKSVTPWERGDNPYDKTRLAELLENKISLDGMQTRLTEIEAEDDAKLKPEYNYLRLRGRHLFHTYLDSLAKLRKDLMEGLVEESAEEWKAFERHETKRIERITEHHTAKEEAQTLLQQPDTVRQIEAAVQPTETPDAEKKKKKKKKKLSGKEKEKRFKAKMEKKEVEKYMEQMRLGEEEEEIRTVVEEVQAEREESKFMWGTLPPGREHLEYQAHVLGTNDFKGWSWERPVYYVPRIPWREARAKEHGSWPYKVDESELPMDWEENYQHFPYYKRQQLWEDPSLNSPVPSTEPDWPSRDKDFIDIYLSKTDYTHPGDWDIILGRKKPSKYKTLRNNSLFEDKFYMSPYENPDFNQFMNNPTKVPQHRLGMDLLGF